MTTWYLTFRLVKSRSSAITETKLSNNNPAGYHCDGMASWQLTQMVTIDLSPSLFCDLPSS